MVDELEEVKDNLVDITKLLSRSSGEAFKFKQQLLGMNDFVEGKNYQIISRFLSGTGAWKVLNKAKASVLTLMQIMNASERAAERDAQRFEKMAKASKEMAELEKVAIALGMRKEKQNIQALKAALPYYDQMAESFGGESKFLAELKKNVTRQIEIQQGLVDAAGETRSTFERLGGLRTTLLDKAKDNMPEGLKKSFNTPPTRTEKKQLMVLNGILAATAGSLVYDNLDYQLMKQRVSETKENIKDKFGESSIGKSFGTISKKMEGLDFWAENSKKNNLFLGTILGLNEQQINFVKKHFTLEETALGFIRTVEKLKAIRAKLTLKNALQFSKKVGSGILKFMGKVLFYALRFTIWATLILGVLFVAYRTLKAIEPSLREGFSMMSDVFGFMATNVLGPLLDNIKEGLGLIITGFQEGSFLTVIGGLLWAVGNSVLLIGSLIVTGIVMVIGGLLGLVVGQLKDTHLSITGILYKIGEIARNIFYVAGTILLIYGLFVGLPFILAGAVLAGVAMLLDEILAAIPGFSSGGITGSGLSIVGERGPELVKLPTGSRVYSNADSKRMLGGSGGNTINVHVNGRVGASDAEIRDIANKVAREINIRMNQTRSTVSML